MGAPSLPACYAGAAPAQVMASPIGTAQLREARERLVCVGDVEERWM